MEPQSGARVVAVCARPTGGVPKELRDLIVIKANGVEGDYHAGPVNRHKKKGDPEPNWRQVTLVAQEVLDSLNARLGIHLKAGDLGENILVAGLGDLSQLQKGERLHVGQEAVLEMTAQNRPCDTIRVYHPSLPEEIAGRRGVAAVVVQPGPVRPGDTLRVTTRP
ncbi:MAG: MOSC domain-containing protein [Chloroflexi bacterium]|nr:MOSC domain-containing protein [Chloroflexota bacterium]